MPRTYSWMARSLPHALPKTSFRPLAPPLAPALRLPALPAAAGDDSADRRLCLALLWAGALWLGYARKPVRLFCLALPLLALCLFLPGRPTDSQTLQQAYAASLRR